MKKITIKFAHNGVGDGNVYHGFETAIELLNYITDTSKTTHDKHNRENILFCYETGTMFETVNTDKIDFNTAKVAKRRGKIEIMQDFTVYLTALKSTGGTIDDAIIKANAKIDELLAKESKGGKK